jgi:heme-degrading monooxygenase HmoA
MFRDDRDGETEFMTISYWESLKAMTGGSGDDPRHPHHLERDKDFLIELPQTVQVLKILDVS